MYVYTCTYLFTLQYDRSTDSASCFSLQYPVVSLKSSSSCLCLLTRLPVTSILPSLFFNNVFYKAIPTQYITNLVSFSISYIT